MVDYVELERGGPSLSQLRRLARDPVLIIGSLLSAATAVLLEIVPAGPPDFVGIIIGLFLIILTLQVQMLLSERDRLDRQTLYGQIAASIESSDWIAGEARRVISSTAEVGTRFAESPLTDICRPIFSRISDQLDELSNGYFMRPYGDRKFAVEIVSRVSRSMRALSVERPGDPFWDSIDGREYMAAMVDALARGVSIQRVFIYTEWDAPLENVARQQLAAGIEVRRVHENEIVDPGLRVTQHTWDDVAAFELICNDRGERLNNRFTVVPREVDLSMRRFERVWSLAEGIPPSTPTIP